MSRFKIVITAGDPAGVAPELLVELLSFVEGSDQDRELELVVYGPPALNSWLDDQAVSGDHWRFAPCGELDPTRILDGNPDAETGAAARIALVEALESIGTEEVEGVGLLTLPLSKHAVRSAGFESFTGHTELLEDWFQTEAFMSFFGDRFNVGLLTRHVPVGQVPDRLDETSLREAIVQVDRELGELFGRDPELALLGLNPHAGEGGTLGSEESDYFESVVRQLRSGGINLVGPVPADSFLPVRADSVDMTLACYHDQGLAPFKLEHFYTGVHATLGLPVLRVSPDHGVAGEIAGSGEVDPRSTLNCFRWLVRHGIE